MLQMGRRPTVGQRSSQVHARLGIVLGLLVFGVTLHYIYRTSISPSLTYAGLTYRDPDTLRHLIAWGLVLTLSMALPITIDCVSAFILWTLFITTAAPAILIAQYSKTLQPPQATEFGLVVFLAILIMTLGARANPLRIRMAGQIRESGLWFWVAALSVAITLYMALFVGIRLSYLSFAEVYSIRRDFASSAVSAPLIGYLLPAQFNVLNPALMYAGVRRHRPLLLGIGALGQLIAYLTTGQKVIALSIPLIFVLGLLFRTRDTMSASKFLAMFNILVMGSFLVDRAMHTYLWVDLTVRRFIVVPGVLAAAYVAVFAARPKGYFQDVLGTASPTDSAPLIVGREFISDSLTSANASLFGHGYYSLGYPGILIEATFCVLLLWLADLFTRDKISLGWAIAIFSMPTVALTNSSPFTTLATHGFGAAVVLAYFLARSLNSAPDVPHPAPI